MESNSKLHKGLGIGEEQVETLTEMLEAKATGFNSEDAEVIKDVVKEWLRGVGLTSYYSCNRDGIAFNTSESIRRLLVASVDELSFKKEEI